MSLKDFREREKSQKVHTQKHEDESAQSMSSIRKTVEQLEEENTKLTKTLKRSWQEIKYWKAAM